MTVVQRILVVFSITATCWADEFVLHTEKSGPIKLTTSIDLDAKQRPHLALTGVNQTEHAIQRLTLCVSSPQYKKGCLFTIRTTRELAVDEVFKVEVSGPRKLNNTEHNVTISSIEQFVPPAPGFPPALIQFVRST